MVLARLLLMLSQLNLGRTACTAHSRQMRSTVTESGPMSCCTDRGQAQASQRALASALKLGMQKIAELRKSSEKSRRCTESLTWQHTLACCQHAADCCISNLWFFLQVAKTNMQQQLADMTGQLQQVEIDHEQLTGRGAMLEILLHSHEEQLNILHDQQQVPLYHVVCNHISPLRCRFSLSYLRFRNVARNGALICLCMLSCVRWLP